MDSDTTSSELSTGSRASRPSTKRFPLAILAFMIFEALLIAYFGDRFYPVLYDGIWFVLMVTAAGIGYYMLGFLAGSWLTAVALLAPPLIAFAFGYEGPIVGYADGTLSEGPALYERWLVLSLLFVPMWALGVVSARRGFWKRS